VVVIVRRGDDKAAVAPGEWPVEAVTGRLVARWCVGSGTVWAAKSLPNR